MVCAVIEEMSKAWEAVSYLNCALNIPHNIILEIKLQTAGVFYI